MKKISFSLLLAFLLLGLLATAVSAESNANKTGEGETYQELIKSLGMYDNGGNGPKDQKVHGSYQNNTNSCASCHQTHASTENSFLFTEASLTCMACHDGTLGFYDVEASGAEYLNSSSTAGTFGGNTHYNSSMHNVFGGNVKNSAAPGGNKNGTAAASWGGTFTCASCHAPHGSHSDRLLHYNPNNMANTAVAAGGKKQENIAIADADGKKDDGTTATGHHIRVNGTTLKLYNGNNIVITPWLNSGWQFRPKTGSNNNGLTVDFRSAVANASSTEVANTYIGGTADIPVTYSVKLAKDNLYVSEISNVDWKHNVVATMNNTTENENYSDFCASCHTDYVKGKNKTSTFKTTTNAEGEVVAARVHGHTARSGSNGGRSCMGCHFAHGNDVDIMVDARGKTVHELVVEKDWTMETARNYMKDNNDSSALKKYTNMSVCFACHNSSRATYFVNQTPSAEQPTGWSNTNDPSTKKLPNSGN